MWKNINLGRCVSYINSQTGLEGSKHSTIRPAVTISRMCGAGGRTVASSLAEHLQTQAPAGCHWTVFDKDLIGKVLEDHHLSKRIAEFLPEDHKSLLAEAIEKLRGLHPPTATLVQQTAETIWNLAEGGYVILVGRGANIITLRLENVFHVRLVGSFDKRVQRVEEVYEMDRFTAQEYVKSQDAAKRNYLNEYFGADIDDPLLYHLIINTDDISYEQTAQLVGDAFGRWLNLEPRAET
jgi:cytidylate kinase